LALFVRPTPSQQSSAEHGAAERRGKDPAMTQEIDVIELLERDHDSITQLVEQLDAAVDPVEIRRLYLRIVEDLSAHEAVEHQVVFPAFVERFANAADDTLVRRMGEHEEMNEMLAEMRTLAPDCHAFVKRGSALLLEINGHFLLEEETVFNRMRSACTHDELVGLADRAAAVKRHAPAFPEERPHVVTGR
jgi:hemerythrin superfamily protein